MIATAFNCFATVSDTASFRPLWPSPSAPAMPAGSCSDRQPVAVALPRVRGGTSRRARRRMTGFSGRILFDRDARKPTGGSIDAAIGPDGNINPATRSDTLGTVIGELALDRDARAKSVIGVGQQGKGYFRPPARAFAQSGVMAKTSSIRPISGIT